MMEQPDARVTSDLHWTQRPRVRSLSVGGRPQLLPTVPAWATLYSQNSFPVVLHRVHCSEGMYALDSSALTSFSSSLT